MLSSTFLSCFWPLFVIAFAGFVAYNKWHSLSELLREKRKPHFEEGYLITEGGRKEMAGKFLKLGIVRNVISLCVASGVIVFCIVMLIIAIRNG